MNLKIAVKYLKEKIEYREILGSTIQWKDRLHSFSGG